MAMVPLSRTLSTMAEHPIAFIFGIVISAILILFSPDRLLGLSNITYYHGRESLQLNMRDGSKTTLAKLCRLVAPPCRLNPFIFNGHLQTMWTMFHKSDVPIYYKRRIFQHEDPIYTGEYAVDIVTAQNDEKDPKLPSRTTYFSDPEWEEFDKGSTDSKPMLVVLHGLSGGSHELYLRCVLASLVKDGPWQALVVNSRGCARSKITSDVLYNARATWDARQTIKWLRKKFPNRPLFGCGFSLGANILTNYLGEEGEGCELKAAVLISNVWNNEVSSLALQRTWFMNEVYNRALGGNMKKLFNRHLEQISKNPKIDVQAVQNLTYLHEFDRLVQGPTWGYPTEGAYYRDASSVDAMMGIRVPFLGIHAEDDPVVIAEAMPKMEVQATPYGVLCATTLGGHLGWFELGGGRWFVKPTVAFLQKMATDVDLESVPRNAVDGMIGHISRPKREPLRPVFDPTRRKLHLPA